jgi:predicted amidohydrolase
MPQRDFAGKYRPYEPRIPIGECEGIKQDFYPMQTLEIALLQPNTIWHDPQANRQLIVEYLNQLEKSVQLIVLPETWATGFTMTPEQVAEAPDGPSVLWMQKQAKAHKAAVCGSLAIVDKGQFYNRFFFVHPDGRMDTYDKYHPYTPSGESRVYRSGTDSVTIVYMGWRIRPIICYDLRFPVFCRNNDDYDLLICVANWPEARIQAWNTLLSARAIENMAYTLGVNRVGRDAYRLQYPGHSAIYNEMGDREGFLDEDQTIAHIVIDKSKLETTRKKLPFLLDRDDFTLR